MKQALYYIKLKGDLVKCELCPRFCVIKPDERGQCVVRKNINGELYSMIYSKPCAVHVDPIEKKPFYHFMPGARAFSIATIGCNFFCGFCQNWQISKADADGIDKMYENLEPEEVVALCRKNKCSIMSYTYTEPTIFYEYMLDIAKLARKAGIKNTMVSNGYINEEPLRRLCKVMDGANIDLKAFTNKFYKEVCKGSLEPVLRTLKILKEEGVWVEVTNLIVPGLNDNFEEIEEMCRWISKELGREVPLHFSRFHPDYKMMDKDPTPLETLAKAKKIAEKYLDYVYLGNIGGESKTRCPKCKEVTIRRGIFRASHNEVNKENCPKCGHKIAGVWE